MPYKHTPLQEYNRHNVFVVQIKELYWHILDILQDYSKAIVRDGIIMGSALLFMWLPPIFSGLLIGKSEVFWIVFAEYVFASLFVSILAIKYLYEHYKNLKYFMNSHIGMQKFSEVSDRTLDEILRVNLEEIFIAYNELKRLEGSVEFARIELKNLVQITVISSFGIFVIHIGDMIFRILGIL